MKNKYTLILLAILFFVPLATSWGLYFFGTDWLTGRSNYGQLLNPTLQLDNLPLIDENWMPFSEKERLAGKWLFITFSPLPCKELCERNLNTMRQTRFAMGKDQTRIETLFITPSNQKNEMGRYQLKKLIEKKYPHLIKAEVDLGTLQNFLEPFPDKSVAMEEGYLFIADPLGNIILGYSSEHHPDDVFNDIKKLLKLSQIG